MTTFNLDACSLAELKALHKDVTKAIAEYSDRKKTEAMQALEAHAKELGFSLAELTGGERPDSCAPWQPQHLVKAANRCTGASADKVQLTLVGCADHARQLGFRNYEFRRLLEILRCRGPDTWIG